MNLKIAVPNNKIFTDFYVNEVEDVEVFVLDEQKCYELISTNRVNAAFLSPLGYSQGVAVSDYRIIPGPMLALKNYSGFSSVYFRAGLEEIVNTYADNPNGFIIKAAKILLSEKYDLAISPKALNTEIDSQMADADIIISSKKSYEHKPVLDITEDWFDSFDIPLILGFWVVKTDLEGFDYQSIFNSIAKSNLKPEEVIIEKVPEGEIRESRQGSIIRRWNNDIEYALEETIKLLFYHQFIPNIAAVKILGRD